MLCLAHTDSRDLRRKLFPGGSHLHALSLHMLGLIYIHPHCPDTEPLELLSLLLFLFV